MALSGLWLMALKRKWLSTLTTVGFFTQLFLCIWVPMVRCRCLMPSILPSRCEKLCRFSGFTQQVFSSLPVRVVSGRHGALSLGLLRYWQSGGWMASCNSRPGPDCSGFLYEKSRLTGVFYPKYTLGVALAVLAPFCLEAVRQLSSRSLWPAIALIPYVLIILLAGSRSSWGVFTLVVIGYGLYLFKWSDSTNLSLRAVGRVAAIGVLLIVGLSIVFSDTAGKTG